MNSDARWCGLLKVKELDIGTDELTTSGNLPRFVAIRMAEIHLSIRDGSLCPKLPTARRQVAFVVKW